MPQNICGCVLILIIHRYVIVHDCCGHIYYCSDKMRGGISLGKYIVLNTKYMFRNTTVNHEFGHAKQSKYLGWLYLPVVGLPSIIHAWVHKYGDYYEFWTERWADKLGNVKR